MTKPIISFALVAFASVGAMAAGCSAADPGVEYTGPRHLDGLGGGSSTSTGTSAPASDDAGSAPTSTGAGTPDDSGTGTGTTSAAKDGAAATSEAGATADDSGTSTAFLGEATAFKSVAPPQTAAAAHAGAGQAAQTPTLDCMAACHAAGGAGGQFLFAGFVATTAGGTTGAAGVEVRAYNGTTGYSAYTDTNGYFWMLPPTTLPNGPFNMGARNATTTDLMPSSQTTIDCQSCHGGGTGVIHVP
jgi:hypothetical protein